MALVDTRVLDHTGTRSAGVAARGQRNDYWLAKRLLTEEEEQATVRSNVVQFGPK